ncbi:hypothetical protein SeMB42_g06515 [Synchytrium endobioticum]|uniref:C2H2-type domain-containing protein n=1 Tax=Synchytrium endobioticum TaxID=286115 RepID=A0A507CHS0_9FUNG|nr:hypothetical protein SeMB42_g06515 [Synchytrium endobioticum]TPX48963.1 hypothetical protein SeLEV6574_g01729 [Synchytrium endobioticum]
MTRATSEITDHHLCSRVSTLESTGIKVTSNPPSDYEESDIDESVQIDTWTSNTTSEGVKLDDIVFCPLPDCPTNQQYRRSGTILYLILSFFGAPSDKGDAAIRSSLRHEQLTRVLQVQQDERDNASWKRKCLFCRIVFHERSTLLQHMWDEHHLNIGAANGIVWLDAFLDVLERKLADLQCLYCERIYRDQATLRIHMRKKKHFKLRQSREYDKYYVVNYTDRNWRMRDGGSCDDDDESWEDWKDSGDGNDTMCLFCDDVEKSADLVCAHVKEKHRVDLYELRRDLTIYQYIALINYLRKQFISHRCFSCHHQCEILADLINHLEVSKHGIPKPPHELYDDPQYLFPTVDGDALLMVDLGDCDDEDEKKDMVVVAEPVEERVPDLRDMSVDERMEWLSNR